MWPSQLYPNIPGIPSRDVIFGILSTQRGHNVCRSCICNLAATPSSCLVQFSSCREFFSGDPIGQSSHLRGTIHRFFPTWTSSLEKSPSTKSHNFYKRTLCLNQSSSTSSNSEPVALFLYPIQLYQGKWFHKATLIFEQMLQQTLGIQSPPENSTGTSILWRGGDSTSQSLSDNMTGSLGKRSLKMFNSSPRNCPRLTPKKSRIARVNPDGFPPLLPRDPLLDALPETNHLETKLLGVVNSHNRSKCMYI